MHNQIHGLQEAADRFLAAIEQELVETVDALLDERDRLAPLISGGWQLGEADRRDAECLDELLRLADRYGGAVAERVRAAGLPVATQEAGHGV